MDFILGSNETEKTTCLLELANKYIIENNINSSNGYILLFTPPHFQNNNDNIISNKIKNKGYFFKEYLTNYMPQMKENMNLIKGYALNNYSYAFGLINNFLILSEKSKGLKLILIDDITSIVNPWINEIIKKKVNTAKSEEKKNIENLNNILLIYNEVFQQFLSKIKSLQKCYQIQCFISLNINISDHINFTKISPRIFNAIFPFIRTIFYLKNIPSENKIAFNEIRLILNPRTDKINYEIIDEQEKNDNQENINNISVKDDKFLDEYINKKEKKLKKNNNFKSYDNINIWMKDSISQFIYNINEFKVFQKKIEEQKKKEEDSSCTQYEKI